MWNQQGRYDGRKRNEATGLNHYYLVDPTRLGTFCVFESSLALKYVVMLFCNEFCWFEISESLLWTSPVKAAAAAAALYIASSLATWNTQGTQLSVPFLSEKEQGSSDTRTQVTYHLHKGIPRTKM